MILRRLTATLPAVILVGALAACGAEEDGETETVPASFAESAEMTGPELPDTTVEAVWSHLQEQGYESWAHFPGKGDLYAGGEPHGALLTTYVNATAADGLEGGSPVSIPVGGILVKENYMPDSTLAAVTVMYKTDGFNPDHNDWWFLKRAADGTVEASGRVEGCQSCHGGARSNDYVLTPIETSEASGSGATSGS